MSERVHRRPIVGVTGPDRGGLAAWFFTALAILRAGGRPKRITPSRPARIEELDALVIGGGADVDPTLYGRDQTKLETVVKETKKNVKRRRTPWRSMLIAPFVILVRRLLETQAYAGIDPARDELERNLIAAAVDRKLPVLGICRGAQLLNVSFGGTLHRDLESFYVETPQIFTVLPRKLVEIEHGSHLARVIGSGTCAVNALHRQAIDTLGEGVKVAAREPNGVIQAIERVDRSLCIGVQWHPEYIPQHSRQRALFRALVGAAAGKLSS